MPPRARDGRARGLTAHPVRGRAQDRRNCAPRSSARRGASWCSSSSTPTPASWAERSAHGQQDRHAGGLPSTSWRRATSSAPIRSTWSGWPGTSSAPNTTGPARSRSRRWPPSTSPAGTSWASRSGVPVWKLLGGQFRDRVPAYANGWYQAERDPQVDRRAWPRGVVARLPRAQARSRSGASAELSAAERRRAVAIVAAVREAVGPDVQIMVEMHGRFTPATAAAVAALLEPYDPEWIEEPVPPENAAALAPRARGHAPAHRHRRARPHHGGHPRLHRGGLVDIVQVDLTHFGGFLPMKRLAGWADAYYLLLAPHNVCGPVGTMANLHFAVATPNYKVLEHFNDFADSWVHDLVDPPPRIDPQRRLLHPARAARPRPEARSRGLRRASAHRRPHQAVRRGLGAPRLRRREDGRQAALMTAARRRAGAGRAGGARRRAALGRARPAPALGRHHARPRPRLRSRDGRLPERRRRPAGRARSPARRTAASCWRSPAASRASIWTSGRSARCSPRSRRTVRRTG